MMQKGGTKWPIYTVLSFVLIVLFLVGWYGWHYLQAKQLSDQIPSKIRQSLSFDIYMPAKSGYFINSESFVYDSGVLQFTGVTKNGNNISVSQQKKPTNTDFDLGRFLTGEGLSGGRQFYVNIGQVLIGSLKNRAICIIDTGKTIITISNTSNADTLQIEELARILLKT